MMTITLDNRFILSERVGRLGNVHHPWRRLRDHLPDWDVVYRVMPVGIIGTTDVRRRVITLDSRMLQAQRRACLDHELHHAEAGDVGCQHPHREAAINQSSARRLIPLSALLEAVKWAHNAHELADDLWVDLATLECRLDHLHPAERELIRRALALRDNREV